MNFPQELLDQSPEEKLNYFQKHHSIVKHRNLEKTFNELKRKIYRPTGSSIILVIGPHGVGKTTLQGYFTTKIHQENQSKMKANPAWIPIVNVQAKGVGDKPFGWKDFYKQVLLTLDEPQVTAKSNYPDIIYHEQGIKRGKDGRLLINTRATEDSLRNAMEQALKHRNPYTLAVDEFQHIGIRASNDSIKAHLDCVKSVVNETNVTWTGFGTYELLRFLKLSPQLTRRTYKIHFPRYRYEVKEELTEFKQVLKQFLLSMPFPKPCNKDTLKQVWHYCHQRSIGCVGILLNWLTNAYELALLEDANTLSLSHLEQSTCLTDDCEEWIEQVVEGEQKLYKNTKSSTYLLTMLGMNEETSSEENNQETPLQEENKNQESQNRKTNNQGKKKSKSGKSNKPPQRNPKRDAVQ